LSNAVARLVNGTTSHSEPSRFLTKHVLSKLQPGSVDTSSWAKHPDLLQARVDPNLKLTEAAKAAIADAKANYHPVCDVMR
jgi:hypothetical protein